MDRLNGNRLGAWKVNGISHDLGRRDFLRRGMMATAALTGSRLGLPGSAEIARGAARARPNIVFIMADGMGYGDPGCYGQDKIQTPNMDRLAKGGIRFTQAYAGGTVCTPSRSCLMTGTHGGHTPARDNVPHFHKYLEGNRSRVLTFSQAVCS